MSLLRRTHSLPVHTTTPLTNTLALLVANHPGGEFHTRLCLILNTRLCTPVARYEMSEFKIEISQNFLRAW